MAVNKKTPGFMQSGKLFIFTLISLTISLSTITSILYSPPTVAESTVEKKVKTWLYYRAVTGCFNGFGKIGAEHVAKNEVGSSMADKEAYVGVYISGNGTDGDGKCGDVIKNGLSLWGYSSLESLLKDAGFTLDGSNWVTSKPSQNAIGTALQEKSGLKENAEDYLDAEGLYSLYYTSFVYACKVTGEEDYNSASDSSKQLADSKSNGYVSYEKYTKEGVKKIIGVRGYTGTFGKEDPIFAGWGLSELKHVGCSGKELNDFLQTVAEAARKLGSAVPGKTKSAKEDKLAETYWSLLRDKAIEQCASSGAKDKQICEEGMHVAVKTCVQNAEKEMDKLDPYDRYPAEARDKKLKSLFTDCFAKASGIASETIAAAIASVSPSTVKAGVTYEPEPDPSGSGGEEPKDKCAIDGIGWLVCPVVTFLAQVSDTVKDNIDEYLVFNPSELTKRDDGSVYSYWATMRNYANVLFVIAFIIIIYSQISGMGLSTYGIKRMLPRLVVGALLVNVSFYLCAAMVDLSNAIGASAYNFISSGTSAGSGGASPSSSASGDAWWATTATTLLVGGAVLFFALGAFIAGLITVLMIALTTLLLLGVRQAIIIFAIIISPLAFVAWLLPNTESLFKKWWQTFKTMLFVYPIIGIIYGASTLASNIIRNQYGGTDGSSVAMQIVAAVLMFVPLLLVPKVLNTAMSIGNIAAITGGLVKGKAGGFLGGAAKAKIGKLGSRFGNYRKMKKERRNAQIRSGVYQGRGGMWNMRNFRSRANRRFNKSRISGGYGDMRAAQGAKEAAHQDHERMEMAEARINNMQVDGAYLNQQQLMEAATTGKVGDTKLSSYEQRAAIKKAAAMGTSKDALELAESSANQKDATVRKEIADALAQSGAGERSPYLGGAALADIQAGKFNRTDAIKKAAAGGKITAESLSKADAYSAQQIESSLGELKRSDAYTKGDHNSAEYKEIDAAIKNAMDAADTVKKTAKLKARISGNSELSTAIEHIRDGFPEKKDQTNQNGSSSGNGSSSN